ncbi:MAG TPA: hypothetical protein DCP08_03790 [Chloroflexi bacterium]|nr:hypothetical protein [Chloroflexota bacterium]
MTSVLVTRGAGNLGRQVGVTLAECGHSAQVFDLPGLDYFLAGARVNIKMVLGMTVVTVTPSDVRMQVMTEPDFHIHERASDSPLSLPAGYCLMSFHAKC